MGNGKRPKVLVICGDPGGANALAPVVRALRADGRVAVECLAYQHASATWKERGVSSTELSETTDQRGAAAYLEDPEATLLVCGTSYNGIDLEKQFIAAAKAVSVPSIAVLDFWSNYDLRFGDEEGRLCYVPDLIAVMDEQARMCMSAAGFEADKLVVTGQPAFDDLAQIRVAFTPEQRTAVRNGLGLKGNELLVMFASQPLSMLFGSSPADAAYLGYDENSVLCNLVEALESVATKCGQLITLLHRPHPRDITATDKMEVEGMVRVIRSRDGNAHELLMTADLVTGMTTILLVDACLLGCVTVSLQPGLRGLDVLPTNTQGYSVGVFRSDDVHPTIEKMLLDEQARIDMRRHLAAFKVDGRATQRVTELIYDTLRLQKATTGRLYG